MARPLPPLEEGSVKVPVAGALQVRTYEVLRRCVEEGVARGWRRAHKHVDAPSEDAIRAEIETSVLGEISDYFDFDDPTR